MKKVLMLLLVMVFGLAVYAAEKVQVTLSRVNDGDTIEVINENNQKEKIRLKGIDCFETSEINRAYKQAYQNKMTIEEVIAKGVQQKNALIKLFEDNSKKHLYLVRCGKDVYKRTLGIIYLGNLNINQYMLKSGNAMEYIYIRK